MVVYCACPAEITSLRVAEELRAAGIADARALTGGWVDWFNCGQSGRAGALMRFAPEYVKYVLNENFDDAKELFLAPLMSIHYAHLVMLADRGIVRATMRTRSAPRSTPSRSPMSAGRSTTADRRTCSSTSTG